METISRLPRRLTQLYSDTKTTCDAVVEQDAKDTPESHALHRKFRIQKDRLITWGVDWSDSSKGRPGDIDESVEEAGMTETVTSVLRTIQEILDEAEKMHPAAPAAGRGKTLSGEKSRPDPPSWAAADRSRYEDLIKDLTTSIDILYDLSRNRRRQRGTQRGPSPGKAALYPPTSTPVFLSTEYNASDLTLVNPATFPLNAHAARSHLPPKLDPSDLFLRDEEPPPYESFGTTSVRVIGRLRSRHSSTNPWKPDAGNLETTVLVDYASYDPTYRLTEVSPPTERLEELLSILTTLSNNHSFHGTLKCLGYFEDPKQPRFGLVFELPTSVYSGPADSHKSLDELKPVSLLSVLQTGSRDLHNPNSAIPPLEDRFRLAFTLALTFSKIHGDGFVHQDVNSDNIMLFRKSKQQSANSRALQYSLRSPVICSFDLFTDFDIEKANTISKPNIYRHPADPKVTGIKGQNYDANFDLYGLGLILLEIGLWMPLRDLWKQKYKLADFKQRIEDVYTRRLASKCGTAYMQVVRDCFWAADSKDNSGAHVAQVYTRILTRLQRCCMLDESEPGFDLSELRPGVTPIQQALPSKRKSLSQPQIATEIHSSPSYKNAKRWALEKGSQALERTKSLSKKSPDLSLTRNPSRGSQHSVRKSLSESLRMMSPKLDAPEMEWEQRNPLEESGTLIATPPNSQDRSDTSSLYRERVITAASIIQRAWRQSRCTPKQHATLEDYKEKACIIQQAWRQTKQKRTNNTVSALVTNGMRHWPEATLGYPTPEPEIQSRTVDSSESVITSSIRIETDMGPTARPKLRLFPVKFTPDIVDEWHSTMLPRLERLIERALKDSEETISIDLVATGEVLEKAKPTVFVTCSSVAKVKAILGRRFRYDENVYDLKVRRGKIRRSKMSRSSRRTRPPHRSMMNTDSYDADMAVMNPYHQQRPLCGASIGAFNGQHLPPVSYGGVILVDDEPLGMSVHHLLDAPSDDESNAGDDDIDDLYPSETMLSSAANNPWLMGMGAQPGLHLESDEPAMMWDLELSENEEDFGSDCEDADEYYDSEESDDDSSQEMTSSTISRATTGDIDGILPGHGSSIKITQPAIDDVDPDFFPEEEDRDDDHLSSHTLGHVHASSGIRRWNREGILHEIDWALLKLDKDRLQPYNICQGGRRFCPPSTGPMPPSQRAIAAKLASPVNRRKYTADEDEYPNGIAPAAELGGMNVHCFGRTTGLQGGMVSSTMSAVRIYHRKSFSRSWHVAGQFGVGGDSGAWVVQNGQHRVVGHVLAFCQRNRIAYICPMEVLLEDIKRTLGARRIFLPGSKEHVEQGGVRGKSCAVEVEGVVSGVRGLGLGIVDSAVDVRESLGRREGLGLPVPVPVSSSSSSSSEQVAMVVGAPPQTRAPVAAAGWRLGRTPVRGEGADKENLVPQRRGMVRGEAGLEMSMSVK
ncbi:HeLo domain containing protein [Pyrenophora teres f. teres]|uniref:HeLo domain containing protein n=1 Tax=Pyrenophora teres f. teres TaxID=97479 RepID=A0A6S6VTU6_9PLEO|nr:HeLo domain containing protein [Pyrenophora teres f. teres]